MDPSEKEALLEKPEQAQMEGDFPGEASYVMGVPVSKEVIIQQMTDPENPRELDVSTAVRHGFKMFCENPMPFILWSIVLMVLSSVVSGVTEHFFPAHVDPEDATTKDGFNDAMSGLINGAVNAALLALNYGPFVVASNSLRSGGTGYALSDLYTTPYKYFCPLLLISAIQITLTGLGFICLVIPGLYLAVTLQFAAYFYIEYFSTGFTVIECFSVSRRVAHGVFWKIVLLMFASFCIAAMGYLFFFVGIFVATPIIALAWADAFHQVFTMNDSYDGHPEACVCCC